MYVFKKAAKNEDKNLHRWQKTKIMCGLQIFFIRNTEESPSGLKEMHQMVIWMYTRQ